MTDEPPTLASRLERAYTTTHSPSRGPWTDPEVSQRLKELGVLASPSHLWSLRKGRRENPSFALVDALAKVFDLPLSYFTESDDAQADHALAMAQAMATPEVRELVSEVSSLPGPVVSALTTLLREVRSAPSRVTGRKRRSAPDES
ncbi:helix-turn-helix domain-containing protein [Enterococcus hirae]|uniref:helix-turn-helix domain-containing protein n=1 Tax=Enterococcus hirae TaxID=1354 RepID=UPI001368E810|nr:helix-turn-helix domain-containing protein [Enterococcus hirae]NAE18028.1 hypothetical protein [Enterococcus hirae]